MPSVASDDGQTDQLHRKFANVIKEHGPLEVTDGHILHLFIQLTAQERKLIMAHGSIKAFVSQSNCIRIDGNTLRLNDSTPLSRFMPTVCSETPKDDSYSPVSTDVSQTPLRVNSPDSVQHSVHNSSEFMLPGNADVFLRTVSPSSSQSSESSLQSTKIFAHQCTEDVHSEIGNDQLESLNCFTGMNSVGQEKVEKSVQTTCRGDDLVEKDDHSSLLIRARQAEEKVVHLQKELCVQTLTHHKDIVQDKYLQVISEPKNSNPGKLQQLITLLRNVESEKHRLEVLHDSNMAALRSGKELSTLPEISLDPSILETLVSISLEKTSTSEESSAEKEGNNTAPKTIASDSAGHLEFKDREADQSVGRDPLKPHVVVEQPLTIPQLGQPLQYNLYQHVPNFTPLPPPALNQNIQNGPVNITYSTESQPNHPDDLSHGSYKWPNQSVKSADVRPAITTTGVNSDYSRVVGAPLQMSRLNTQAPTFESNTTARVDPLALGQAENIIDPVTDIWKRLESGHETRLPTGGTSDAKWNYMAAALKWPTMKKSASHEQQRTFPSAFPSMPSLNTGIIPADLPFMASQQSSVDQKVTSEQDNSIKNRSGFLASQSETGITKPVLSSEERHHVERSSLERKNAEANETNSLMSLDGNIDGAGAVANLSEIKLAGDVVDDGEWKQVSKKHKKPPDGVESHSKDDFEKMIQDIQSSVLKTKRPDVIKAVQEVRQKHGKLKGLSINQIKQEAIAILKEKFEPACSVTKEQSSHMTETSAKTAEGNLLYKTSICVYWQQGICKRTAKECVYAHGKDDLRSKPKNIMCQNIINKGTCPYGEKCLFAHSEQEMRRAQSKQT